MAGKFTESKERRAKEILDNALDRILTGKPLPFDFEEKLKNAWNAHYTELKQPMIAMLKHKKYYLVAIKYMESQFPMPEEFKIPLAEIYGIRYYDSPECKAARNAYWMNLKNRQ